MTESLGDRMKVYEGITESILMPSIPILARIDGRAFHTFTRGLEKPYDKRIHILMRETTKALVAQMHATIGYTQSDEISLLWHFPDFRSQPPFGGRVQKLTSVLASIASAHFNELKINLLPDKPLAAFDCRVWNVPNEAEAANYFLWRERDATKNSISMAAQSVCSHKELHKKNGNEMQEMLWQRGINWNDYPDWFKRGTFVRRVAVKRPMTAMELSSLPLNHEARKDPNYQITRHEIQSFVLPILGGIENREDVLLRSADPIKCEAKGE